MAELLFKLRNVPDDEAEDVRTLLEDHGIDYYETHAGSWGVSMPAIWLHDGSRLKDAKALLENYQQQRSAKARAAYAQMKSEGKQQTVMAKIMQHPMRFVMLILALAFILYVSLSPFFDLGH